MKVRNLVLGLMLAANVLTAHSAKKALEKIVSQKDKFEKCFEKSKRNSSLNKIQKFQHKLQKEF